MINKASCKLQAPDPTLFCDDAPPIHVGLGLRGRRARARRTWATPVLVDVRAT